MQKWWPDLTWYDMTIHPQSILVSITIIPPLSFHLSHPLSLPLSDFCWTLHPTLPGIRFSAVAPLPILRNQSIKIWRKLSSEDNHGKSDFLLNFQGGPSLTATQQDNSKILWEDVAAFKGTVYDKSPYGRTILPKDYNIHALDLLKLEEKGWYSRGATLGDQLYLANLSFSSTWW